MNIIKFNNYKFDPVVLDERIGAKQMFFNKYLAGKYAYLIHQKYVFGFPTTELVEVPVEPEKPVEPEVKPDPTPDPENPNPGEGEDGGEVTPNPDPDKPVEPEEKNYLIIPTIKYPEIPNETPNYLIHPEYKFNLPITHIDEKYFHVSSPITFYMTRSVYYKLVDCNKNIIISDTHLQVTDEIRDNLKIKFKPIFNIDYKSNVKYAAKFQRMLEGRDSNGQDLWGHRSGWSNYFYHNNMEEIEPCGEYTNVKIPNVTTNSVNVKFSYNNKPSSSDGFSVMIVNYTTRLIKNYIHIADPDGNIDSIINGLDSNTEYSMFIRYEYTDESGDHFCDWSEPYNFKTLPDITDTSTTTVEIEEEEEEIPYKTIEVHKGIDIDTYKEFDKGTNEDIEKSDKALDNYLIMDDIKELQKLAEVQLIDEEATSKINDINYYKALNDSVLDSEVPEEQIKRFRQWLAETLVKNHIWNSEYTDDIEKIEGMLNYYAQNMVDDIIKGFILFPSVQTTHSVTIQSGCECGGSMTQLQVGPFDSVCDPVTIYRMNIYNYMVEVFSDTDYWLGQRELCGVIKEYVDEIIKHNFILSSNVIDRFEDCTCKNSNITEQERLMNMLEALSTAMGYIATEQEKGNKNFILKSLNDWAKYLYEKMYWM